MKLTKTDEIVEQAIKIERENIYKLTGLVAQQTDEQILSMPRTAYTIIQLTANEIFGDIEDECGIKITGRNNTDVTYQRMDKYIKAKEKWLGEGEKK